MLTPIEARERLTMIRRDLSLPKLMYANEVGPQGDLYRALAGVVKFLEDALA